MMGLLLAVVVGLSVYGAFQGVRLYRADAKLPGDLAIALEVGATRTTAVGSGIDRLGMRYAPSVLRMMGPKRVDALRRRLDMAGNPGGMTVDRYAARRAVYGFLGAFAALALLLRGQPIIAILALAYGLVWTDVIIRSHIARRKEDIERTLPDFLDVLAVVVSAGLGFRQALERVAEKYKGPWSDELRITLRQMDMGVSRREAFDQLRRRNASEQVSMFVTALQQGEELGAPIVDTLIQIANDMRRTDAQNARRRAAQAVPKTTLVVTMVMLPATMLLIVLSFYYGSGVDFGDILGQ
ncbi:membrane protein [Streptomyces scopuliridis RB72]|uniref:Membrane protein n=2 Tax=Streptomyces scopuliridis TaxID=452529 RepID=A0A2T7TA47_9ACTN|nr:membrane protein [Streptomyces scopuliridis RB72]